eukprot:105965_1
MTSYSQCGRECQKLRMTHQRHAIPYMSIRLLQEEKIKSDLTLLHLKREDLEQTQLDVLGDVHGVQTGYPVKIFQYHWSGFYLAKGVKDFFIDGGGSLSKYVTMGLIGNYADINEYRYKLSQIKVAIAAPIGACQPHTLMTIHTTSATGPVLGSGLRNYFGAYHKFFGKPYEPKQLVFIHTDCFHGNSNAVNNVLNKCSTPVYMNGKWKYLLQISQLIGPKFISLWCWPHVSHAHNAHTTDDVKKWDEVAQKELSSICYFFMQFLKNSLTTYEILLHINVFFWVLLVNAMSFNVKNLTMTYSGFNILKVDTLLELVDKETRNNKHLVGIEDEIFME